MSEEEDLYNFQDEIEEKNQVESNNNDVSEEKGEFQEISRESEEKNLNEGLDVQEIFEKGLSLNKTDLSKEEVREIQRNFVEGILYLYPNLTIEEISNKLDLPGAIIREILEELIQIYERRSNALTISVTNGNFQMRVKSEYSEKISQLSKGQILIEEEIESLNEEEIRGFYSNLLEGVLFDSESTLDIGELISKLSIPKNDISELLEELIEIYERRPTALTISETDGNFQMRIKPQYFDQISQFTQNDHTDDEVQELQQVLDAQGIFDKTPSLEDRDLSENELREFQRNLIEGALYASGSALTIEEISTKLDISKSDVGDLLKELIITYDRRSTALAISRTGEKYQMQIKSEYSDKVSKFAQGGGIAEKYLRTLTIIALKQPILKSTLVKIRGSGAYEHVQYLEENELINSVKKGRTSELTTTDTYAEMFGLPKDKQEMKKVMIDQLGISEE